MSAPAAAHDAAYRHAERAFRKPSSAVWLRSVCVRTARFEEALQFYVNALGLTLGDVVVHPTTTVARATLLDAEGREVLTLVESDDASARGTHTLTFGMPKRTVMLLRSRLDLQDVDYACVGATLQVHDVDGTLLQIEGL